MRRCLGVGGALVSALVLCGCGENGEGPLGFRTVTIERSDVVRTVEATGTVTPRNSKNGIPVGAQVNGKLIKLFVDYNSTVTNGQIVALIDPLVYEANYKSAVAQLHVNEANLQVRRASLKASEAELTLAEKTLKRKQTLVGGGMAPVSELDSAQESFDRATSAVEQARASVASAEASVEQSRATAAKAEADLGYCTIRSPVNGIVIDRKVEEGETVVSSMNAVPVLSIAEDLNTVWIEAKIPEADVGTVKLGQPVKFTADAYRRPFKGKVVQIRKAATTTNNVVTFPVIIEAENPDEMLFPGMTATLSIETDRAENVPVVAAAAFRFRPKDEDRERVEGEIPRGPKLWFERPDGTLEPLAVKDGVSNGTSIQIVSDQAETLVGREAIVGYETPLTRANAPKDGKENPFMPKFPKRGTKGTAPEPKKK